MSCYLRYSSVLLMCVLSGICQGQAPRNQLDQRLLGISVVDGLSEIKSLLDEGANVNARDAHGNTVLLMAADHGRLEVLRLLTERGGQVNVRNDVNSTPLSSAAHDNDADVVKFLLDHGADVNAGVKNGESPLFAAITGEVWQDRSSILSKTLLLIDHGADIQAPDNRGMTPVHLASQIDTNNDILKLLLERGAQPDVKDHKGDAPLIWCEVGAARLLLDHGADVNTSNNDGTTPLMMAARLGMREKIKLLLARNARPNVRDHQGHTALDYANSSHEISKTDKLRVASILRSHGAR